MNNDFSISTNRRHFKSETDLQGAQQASTAPINTPSLPNSENLVIDNGNNSIQSLSSSTSAVPVNSSDYFSSAATSLNSLLNKVGEAQSSLNSPGFQSNLNGLNSEQLAVGSHALNNANEYVSGFQSYSQKAAIGLSEILQLVNELRRTMGKAYHTDMETQRTNMMKQYDAKIGSMLEAAKKDYAAAISRGVGQIAAGTVGWVPIIGGGSQGFTGIGETVGGAYQYEADKARADVASMEGAIANSQSVHDQFSKYYDDLKTTLGDMVQNVQKTVEDSESSKQGITRNI